MASAAELEWWDKYADVMAEQWFLTPDLNKLIRTEYEEDYKAYLRKDGGRLLEIGCGTGWIGMNFSALGMQVDGTDFSEEQLAIARRLAAEKGLDTIEFFQRDLVNDELNGRFEKYDAVLINAVLHHLSREEYQTVLRNCARILDDGGRIYIYEPINPGDSSAGRALVYPVEFMFRAFLYVINRGKFLQKQHFLDAAATGYTGTSPDEGPIPIETITGPLREEGLTIAEERPYHGHNLGCSMNLMRLKPRYLKLFYPMAYVFNLTDRLLFKTAGWRNYGNNRSVMCAIKAVK